MITAYLLMCIVSVSLSLLLLGASLIQTHCSAPKSDTAPPRLHATTHGQAQQLRRLQLRYLVGYALAVLGDWLQGPYFYKLFGSYGFSRETIQVLFVIGFASSSLVGVVVGALADRFGRKRLCLCYFVIYALGCITLHFKTLWVLIVGRLLSGTATVLLFSVFDSWLVCAHKELKLPSAELTSTFRHAALLNSLAAIAAGGISQAAVGLHGSIGSLPLGGYLAPFDLAIIVMIVGFVVVAFAWQENTLHHEPQPQPQTQPQLETQLESQLQEQGSMEREMWFWQVWRKFVVALKAVCHNHTVAALGIISCLFEASMYAFVIQWTPALNAVAEEGSNLPLGIIFSAFMAGGMLGSQLFGWAAHWLNVSAILAVNLLVAATSLLVPILWVDATANQLFYCFFVFEVCVGVYWPAISVLKGLSVPENVRASVYALFHVPLNLTVVCILTTGHNTTILQTFTYCVAMLVVAFICAVWLALTRRFLQDGTLAQEAEPLIQQT